MKIFISWSGKKSKKVAEILRDWLPQVIQAIDPWLSNDIEKGKRWSKEISDSLEESKVGIICLDRDNLHEDWINFEAGALSKTKDAYVCTFLLDIGTTDVEQPLAQFQHTLYNKDDLFKLLKTINSQLGKYSEKSLPDKVLETAFTTYWDDLENKLNEVKESTSSKAETSPVRSDRQLLEEVLDVVRNLRPFQLSDIIDRKSITIILKGDRTEESRLYSFLDANEIGYLFITSVFNKESETINIKLKFNIPQSLEELKNLLLTNNFQFVSIGFSQYL